MNERPARNFFQALRRMARQVSLYPEDHPLTHDALTVLVAAAAELMGSDHERVLALAGDSFYEDRRLLPHTSLEHNGVLREMQARNIRSMTLVNPTSTRDLFELSAFIAGTSEDLPADGTVRLNEHQFAETTWDQGTMAELRRSYAGGLDALRWATYSVATEGACDLAAVMRSVEGFLGPSLEHASATLLLSTIKSHDEYTFYHSLNVCILSLSLGRMLGLSDEELLVIGAGAALHDIGKTAVSPATINHPGRLSSEQWREVKIHPQEGAQAILAAGGPGHEFASTIALEHHTHFDGTGYPTGHAHHRPHAFSRMVSVVDVYDAVTTRRPYRRAYTPGHALDLILQSSGQMFDPDMTRAYIQLMGIYPPSTLVRTVDGNLVMITEHDPADPRGLSGVIARSGDEVLATPEPVTLTVDQVVEQLLPEEAGLDPAALLQHEAVGAALFD